MRRYILITISVSIKILLKSSNQTGGILIKLVTFTLQFMDIAMHKLRFTQAEISDDVERTYQLVSEMK